MFFKKKNKYDSSFEKVVKSIHNKPVSYVVERFGNDEKTLGKNGGITVTDKEIIILCDAHEVFRCFKKGAIVAELMSNDGVTIKGIDVNTNETRSIIAHYKYYKKS